MEQTQSICVEAKRRLCVNCEWYRLYYRWGDGPALTVLQPTSTGYCTKHGRQCSPLRQVCKEFKNKKLSRPAGTGTAHKEITTPVV